MKKDKTFYGWLFAVILLLLLLGISFYLGISGWYFSSGFSQQADMVLGNNIEITVGKNQASTCSFSFSGGYLPGEKLPQIISVKNDSDEEIVLRAKVVVFNSTDEMSLLTNANWFLNEDGYYYFTDKVISQGKVGLSTHVVIDENAKFSSEKNYILTVICESLSTELEVEQIWGINPTTLKAKLPITINNDLGKNLPNLLFEEKKDAK